MSPHCLPLHLLFTYLSLIYCATLNPFDNLDIPNMESVLNYTMDAEDRNFSKYFHHNTWSLNTAWLKEEPTEVTLSISAEAPFLEKIKNESRMGHCIFDDLFDMHTFKMKQDVEDKFLSQMTDICQLRVEETEALFATDLQDDLKREKYEAIKRTCDLAVEEYTIRVLKVYKEQVKEAASHHYDLRPNDRPRIKYEARIDNHFTRLGFEFLPIVEKHFQICSDQYYRHFRQLPACDKNLDNEEEKKRFENEVEFATAGPTRAYF